MLDNFLKNCTLEEYGKHYACYSYKIDSTAYNINIKFSNASLYVHSICSLNEWIILNSKSSVKKGEQKTVIKL